MTEGELGSKIGLKDDEWPLDEPAIDSEPSVFILTCCSGMMMLIREQRGKGTGNFDFSIFRIRNACVNKQRVCIVLKDYTLSI
jgi:hypothetical protein